MAYSAVLRSLTPLIEIVGQQLPNRRPLARFVDGRRVSCLEEQRICLRTRLAVRPEEYTHVALERAGKPSMTFQERIALERQQNGEGQSPG